MLDFESIEKLMQLWRQDEYATYHTWFLWSSRLKNFRSIRRGIDLVTKEIEDNAFGVAYRGSSLETIVHSIAEQKQIFKGADHAFLWKPKLRIPDIYEDYENQQAFGHFLRYCLNSSDEENIIEAIRRLDEKNIRGLGPAVANILYFLHPTIIPPFNTAIVKGYNLLTGSKVKLGNWTHYLAMRKGILELNCQFRQYLSNDLGAVTGFLFDVGSGRFVIPALTDPNGALQAWEVRTETILQHLKEQAGKLKQEDEKERTHCEIQAWLRDMGKGLGYDVWIAANDRGRAHEGVELGTGCLGCLPEDIMATGAGDAIRLIDVLWLSSETKKVVAAFEVEHSTSIYSGIIRMLDLALSHSDFTTSAELFLVAPDTREKDVRYQIQRPAFRRMTDLNFSYLPYSELEKHRDSIIRFGSDLKALKSISKNLSPN